jgi:transcriptional regulator with XRE-family HTH domain
MSSIKDLERKLAGIAGHLGAELRSERLRRRWSLRELAGRSGTSKSLVQLAESGRPLSLQTYVRLADALGLRLDVDLVDPRRSRSALRSEDPIHAAMAEWFAQRLRRHGFRLAIDEPYQHYQFAGRADVVAWTSDPAVLLHVENRTRFPNVQEALGSYNAKRRYLPPVLAERLGLRGGFRTVTNVMAVLWSAEALHDIRLRSATFAATCPDSLAGLDDWLSGSPPTERGSTSTLVVVDPIATGRSRSRIGLVDVRTARPRFRGYADALAAFRDAGLC